jgi:hypothetical protein
MKCVTFNSYFAECHYAECRYAECRGAPSGAALLDYRGSI